MMTVGLTPSTAEAFTPSTAEAFTPSGVGTMERVVDIQIGMYICMHVPLHRSSDYWPLIPHHSSLITDN